MSRFFICKFCNRKVVKTFLAQHALREHFDRIYREVILGEQTQFGEKGIYLDNEIEETKDSEGNTVYHSGERKHRFESH